MMISTNNQSLHNVRRTLQAAMKYIRDERMTFVPACQVVDSLQHCLDELECAGVVKPVDRVPGTDTTWVERL